MTRRRNNLGEEGKEMIGLLEQVFPTEEMKNDEVKRLENYSLKDDRRDETHGKLRNNSGE
jgi:hypothetical protein